MKNPACDCYETGQWYLCCGSSEWDGMIMDAEAEADAVEHEAEHETSLFAIIYGKTAEDDLAKMDGDW